jgi:hypothetical protein
MMYVDCDAADTKDNARLILLRPHHLQAADSVSAALLAPQWDNKKARLPKGQLGFSILAIALITALILPCLVG